MEIPQDKAIAVVIDLLINIQADLQVIRNIVCSEDRGRTNMTDAEYKKWYNKMFDDNRKATLSQIKAHYVLDFNIDDYLKGLTPDPPDDQT